MRAGLIKQRSADYYLLFDRAVRYARATSVVLLSVIVGGCSASVDGGFGKSFQEDVSAAGTAAYQLQGIIPPRALESIAVAVRTGKESPDLPVAPSYRQVRDVISMEMTAAGARVISTADYASPDMADLELILVFSRFETRKYGNSYKTLIDCSYRYLRSVDRTIVDDKYASVSADAASPQESKGRAVERLARILLGGEFHEAVQAVKKSVGDSWTPQFERIAAAFLVNVERSLAAGEGAPARIAMGEFYLDGESGSIAGKNMHDRLLTSLLKKWPTEKYSFFPRTDLGDVLQEAGLQMAMGSLSSLGMTDRIDYLMLGRAYSKDDGYMVEVKLYEVRTGKIITTEQQFLRHSRATSRAKF